MFARLIRLYQGNSGVVLCGGKFCFGVWRGASVDIVACDCKSAVIFGVEPI